MQYEFVVAVVEDNHPQYGKLSFQHAKVGLDHIAQRRMPVIEKFQRSFWLAIASSIITNVLSFSMIRSEDCHTLVSISATY